MVPHDSEKLSLEGQPGASLPDWTETQLASESYASLKKSCDGQSRKKDVS